MSAAIHPVSGAPCWVSLSAGSLDAAEAFYGAVLGWTFRPGALGEEFRVAMYDGTPVAGIGEVTRTLGVPVGWTPFFAVDSADTVAARVRERGATVAVGPLALGNGRAALAADPDGATFGFWEGAVHSSWDVARGSPPAHLELRTRDAFAAALFYGEVFEWAADAPGRCEVEYREGGVQIEVASHTVATLRGGAIEAAPDPHVRPRWHVSFYVDNVDDTVKAALEAGGTVTDGPRDAPSGRVAGLRDRQGGLFTVTGRN